MHQRLEQRLKKCSRPPAGKQEHTLEIKDP